MIGPQPKDYLPLKKPLRVEVNPRLTVRLEKGVVTLFSRGNTIRMTEWEFDELSMAFTTQRITEIRDEHRKHSKE